jgi:peptide/nickel transport system substrate-binding protein
MRGAHFVKPFRPIALAAVTALAASALSAAAIAETPPDTLVIADKIDDIVSLDPAESFEFSGNDVLNNVYDTLIELDPANLGELVPGVAESWEVSDDGLTYTFKIKDGLTFHSGNPVTAEDAAWSIQRAVKLNKTPAFIVNQFGFTPENVDDLVKAADDRTLTITTDKPYAPSFFYNILTSVVTSVVDKATALGHEQDGDLGYEWLKTNSAGSGAYVLRSWEPSDSVVLEAAEGDYWRQPVEMRRVFIRHVAEPATQRLLLERGDVDIARRLSPVDIAAVRDAEGIKVQEEQRGRIFYLAANQKKEPLNNPKVVEAIKHLIDYDGIANVILEGQATPHQAFLPLGFLGALDEKPFSLDVEKATALLAEAGHPDGFDVVFYVRNDPERLEMAQSIQNALGQAGIRAELRSGTGAEILGEYRARNHELILESWGPDYPDPHTNADTFARNPDNSDDAGLTGVLAWRNAYSAEKTTPMVDAAVVEKDTEKRAEMYREMQRIAQRESPLAQIVQQVDNIAMRDHVENFSAGGSIHSAFYWPVTKN